MNFSNDYVYHFSEAGDISEFVPRVHPRHPERPALVWTIDAAHAPNYLFPRECPRICIACGANTTDHDRQRFFGLTTAQRICMVESRWLQSIQTTTLFCYAFARDSFVLEDTSAGYWVSESAAQPIARYGIPDLLQTLLDCGVEVRLMPSLNVMQSAVAQSTLEFSMIRMRNATLEPA